jgi:hypothetical protein
VGVAHPLLLPPFLVVEGKLGKIIGKRGNRPAAGVRMVLNDLFLIGMHEKAKKCFCQFSHVSTVKKLFCLPDFQGGLRAQ